MKYLATIKSITQEIIEADNIEQARARAEELAEELGSMEVYSSGNIIVKRLKEKK